MVFADECRGKMVRNRLSVISNYQFCAQWVASQNSEVPPSVLDYGCGAGEIVLELLKSNVDAFGCDIFYGGADRLASVPTVLLDSGVIRKMEGNAIPFNDNAFDFVINNQVMEHVQNLDTVLTEIHRVLKPGGMVLSLFPSKEVWHEGHCGIPFLHRLPEGRARIYYAAALRSLGFGYGKGRYKGVMCWSQHWCDYLDKWTHYRTRTEIDSAYCKYFSDIQHIEDYWIQKRTGRRLVDVSFLVSIQRLIVTKLCGMIFVARKLDDHVS